MKVEGIRHVGFDTENLEEMVNFYTELLGVEPYWDKHEQLKGWDHQVHTVKFKCNNDTIFELSEGHIGQHHIAMDVKDVNEGLTFLKDPDGNLLELVNEKLL
jgi:catechol 2,3-dioxygenase-like lactoylglutathione lyase family enzyme